jgi:hypothetical protein
MYTREKKNQIYDFLKDRGAKLIVKTDWVHAEFGNSHYANLVVNALKHRFGHVNIDQAYAVIKIYFYE